MYKLSKALLLSGSAFALAFLSNTVDAGSADQSKTHHGAPAIATDSAESPHVLASQPNGHWGDLRAPSARQAMRFASIPGADAQPL